MKIVLRPPCRECPFLKKSPSGWLGQDSPEEVYAKAHSDGEFGYPCHMDMDRLDKIGSLDNEYGEWRQDPDSVEQCVGALIHAKITAKCYGDKVREAAREILAKLFGTSGILGIEFINHHSALQNSKRRKKC